MIEKEEIDALLSRYNKEKISIGTLGSHSALNIFKGAKEEGFRTICICRKDSEITYRKFPLADEFISVESFSDLLDADVQNKLRSLNTILVPHGSFNAYISMEDILNSLYVPMLGNRRLLGWEIERDKQKTWLERAGLKLPKVIESQKDIDRLVIAKFPGARGGKGYFLANSPESFEEKFEEMVRNGELQREDLRDVHIQEYIIGVNAYFQYFSSLLEDETELLGMDKRYESTIDRVERRSTGEQSQIDLSPTYTIVGNIPLVLRESLLSQVLRMGDNVVKVSKRIAPPGIIGPFCLEAIITDKPEIYTFYLKYGENMYMGRRIAREIKNAIQKNQLEKILY
jgi:5-formaminoimidazole-4-carboxamide-1-(beta)-D-ribofuranosyl 5'-monophosphate synthetase